MTDRIRQVPANRGRALAELRRSNAAGIHGRRRPGRGTTRRKAIARALRDG